MVSRGYFGGFRGEKHSVHHICRNVNEDLWTVSSRGDGFWVQWVCGRGTAPVGLEEASPLGWTLCHIHAGGRPLGQAAGSVREGNLG